MLLPMTAAKQLLLPELRPKTPVHLGGNSGDQESPVMTRAVQRWV